MWLCHDPAPATVVGMSGADRPVILYKRWLLREGTALEDVADLVRARIEPHYRELATDVVLSLESHGTDAVLAIQRWPDRASLERVTSGPGFERWWEAYQPVLTAWDELVDFDAEWETEDLLG